MLALKHKAPKRFAFKSVVFASSVAMVAMIAAHATTTTITLGDEDCFGEDQSNRDAGFFSSINLKKPVPFNNNFPDDPANTDIFTTLGIVTFDFDLDIAGKTLLSAVLETRVAGVDIFVPNTDINGNPIADATDPEGMGFSVNGELVGSHVEPIPPVNNPSLNQRAISSLSFPVPVDALVDGVNTVTITPEQDFGLGPEEAYAVDYVSLSYTAQPVAPPPPTGVIPLPASVLLLGGGLAALGLASGRGPRRG